MVGSSLTRELWANSVRAGSSSNEISFSIALSARARYMAPLSRFTYPSLRASRDATVLFPAPAGPSMAMINLREESPMGKDRIVHGHGRKNGADQTALKANNHSVAVCNRFRAAKQIR